MRHFINLFDFFARKKRLLTNFRRNPQRSALAESRSASAENRSAGIKIYSNLNKHSVPVKNNDQPGGG